MRACLGTPERNIAGDVQDLIRRGASFCPACKARSGLLLLLGRPRRCANVAIRPGPVQRPIPRPQTASPSGARSPPTSSAGTRCGRPTPCPSPPMRPSCCAIAAGRARRACAAPPSKGSRWRAPIRPTCSASSQPSRRRRRAAMPLWPSRSRRAGAARRRARRRGGPGPAARCRPQVEQRLLASFGSAFTPDDHDRRMEALLGNGDTPSASRDFDLGAARRGGRSTRRGWRCRPRSPNASQLLAALDRALRGDGGLILDQAIWLNATGQPAAARQLLAARPPLARPAGQCGALARRRARPRPRRRQRSQLLRRLRHRLEARRSLRARHRRQHPAL